MKQVNPLNAILRASQQTNNRTFSSWFRNLMVALFASISFLGYGQITNYKFSPSSTTYADITGGTTLIAGGNVALGAASLKSAVTPIGFTFNYLGKDYTDFSVAATGHLRFGTAQVGAYDNSAPLNTNQEVVFAAWDWFTVGTVATGGGVSYVVTGAAPNRVLTAQWKVARTANAATAYNFQVKLYEGTNKIEFLYGAGSTASNTISIGLNGISAAEHLYVFPANESLYNSLDITSGYWPTSGRVFTFTPQQNTVNNTLVGLKPNMWLRADQPILYNRTLLNVPAANRTASSVLSNSAAYNAAKSVLNSTDAWLGANYNVATPIDHITLDLGSVQTIDGIATMGRAGFEQVASSFSIKVSNDNVNFTDAGYYLRNEDAQSLHYTDFDVPLTCRYLRVFPTDYFGSKGLRIDAYTKSAATSVADNTAMSQWEDHSGNNFDAANIAGAATNPTYKTNQINFNPAMVFSNAANSQLDMPDQGNIRASFWVSQYTGDGADYDHVLYGGNNPYYHGGSSFQFQWSGAMTDAQSSWWKNGTLGTIATTYDAGATGKPNLISSATKAIGTPLSANWISYQSTMTRSWNGPIAEIITYQDLPTTTQQQVIESYLGIKYGLTIDHNYLTADGSMLWDKTSNATYHERVFGIGRADSQGFHQRQSKSVKVGAALTVGNNNIIGATNASSVGNDIATDNSYLIFGDNNGDLKLNYTSSVNKYFFNRVWKINEVGTIGSVRISIPSYTNSATTTLPNYYTSFFPNNKVYLAMDDDGNFQNGGTSYVEAVAVGSGATATYEVNVDLTNAKPYLAWAVDKDMTDSDNDGVVNPDDIDDDNDGILDAVEQGTCTYPDNTLDELTYTGLATVSAVGTTINTVSTTNNAWRSSYSNQTFKLPIHLEWTTTTGAVNNAMIGLLPVGNVQTTSNWNDGSYKVYHYSANIQVYKPQGVNTPVTTFLFARPYTAGQKMEIDITATGIVTIKQAGVVLKRFKGRVADYKLAISAAYTLNRAFENVKLTSWTANGVCTDLDTDSDGVVNRLDIDSDGDGCNDAIEGGAAILNATTLPFTNVGTNGLADALESTADSGFINYDDIYDTYAKNNTLSACDDHDNDLVLDYLDIDDDNDGVLDLDEQTSCTSPAEVLEDLLWTGNTTVNAYDNIVSGLATPGAANTSSWTSSYSNKELQLPIHLEFTKPVDNIESMIGLAATKDLAGNTVTQIVNNYVDATSYKYYFNTTTGYYGKMPTTWNIPATGYTATQKFEIDINEAGVLTATVNGVMMHRIQAPKSTYKLVVSAKTGESFYNNVIVTSRGATTVCTDLDTDGDGIINRFDLDSDEDGCNDAVEANVGNVSTTVPIVGAVGANGYVNTLETAVDNGISNYASTYANYALSESQNVCLDSDGDSVGNIRDLDDDNDGVPDAIEMNCTAPLFVHKTSENTTTSKKLTGTILKETGNVDYEIAMTGPGVTNPGIFDGGNGIHFKVDGVSSSVNLNLKLTAVAAENSSTPIAPKVQTVEFGPSVPFNTATLTSVANEANNIILTWPGGYGVVYDPYNQLSSHNTGDLISSGDLIVQNVAVTGAQINAGQTWKVKLYMHTDADVYDIKASIFGDAALASEAYGFNVSACAIYDTDTDGLPNHVDTDSDGDGCYDAYEAGAVNTASQQTVTGTFGANGFVSTYETTDDFDATITNAYKATITYNQAISKEINLCTDTDNDGVSNVTDIDDDNDGILDAEEMSCGTAYFTMPNLTTGATAFLQNLTGSASFSNAVVDYDINLVGVNTVFTNATINTQFDNSKDGLHFAFTDNDKVYSQTYKLSPSAPTLIKKVRFGVNVPTNQIYVNQVNDAQSITLTWSPDVKAIVYDPNDQLSTHATGDVITTGTTITTRANYTVAASTWKIEFLTNGLPSEFYLQTTHKATTATNVSIEGYGLSTDLCFVDDTDGDGVADYLDTDSDGDGCGDAFESSAASTPGGATQTVAGPYGANGFANSLETNDTQDAAINYASSSYMAYSVVSACADTDNDGIPDRNDIDDDNDGILDSAEYSCGVGTFVKGYVITSGLGMGYGGTFNNGSAKGSGTMSFTDLSSVTTVSDVTDASNYKVNDANTTYKFKATVAPTNGIISQIAFGPNLPGNTANAAVVNGQQSITVSWNYPIGGIVYDPDDQLTSHTDGQGINPGDVIVTRANYTVSVSTWKVVIPMNYLNRQVDFTANFVGAAALGDESFGISSNICNKVTDLDGDRKANAVDTDSDGDGCFDLVESNSGYYSTLTQETILGTYGTNGYSSLAETNDTPLASGNYTLSNAFLNNAVKGCLDTDGDTVPNVNDIDDDNDGILDQTECPVTPPVSKFGFQQITGTGGRQMYITNKATNVPIGKITIAPLRNISGLDELVGNENDNSVSGHWVDGASANSADRVMTIKFEPVAPYTSLDLKVLATEGGNGIWGFHPRSLRVDGGIAGDGVIKAIPQRYYLRENYQVGQTITPTMRMSTAFSGMLSGSSNKVFIQVQYNANATQAAPLVLKYTWNALAGSVFNENFGFQLLELNPSLTIGKCDYDNDGIYDDLDSDSDNDGCPDTKEAVHGKPYATNNNYILGPYGNNGFSTLVENNDLLTATYATSSWLPKVTNSPKKDYVNELINTRCIIPFIAPAGPTTFCDPGSVVLNINLNGGTTPVSYQWYKNDVLIVGATSNTYTAVESGTFTVLLTYADQSTVLTDPIVVTENPSPAVPTVTVVPGTTVCMGSSATLTSSYAANNQWYHDNVAITAAINQVYTASVSGNYKVEYTDLITGCKSSSTTQIIVVSSLPLAPVVSVTQTTCSVATGTITVTPSGNTGETYSINGTTYQVSNIFAGLAAGTYSVTTKNANGCVSEVRSVVINAQPATPAIPTITAATSTTICSGGSTTLTSSVTTSYQWFKDGTAIVGAINQTYVAIAAGSYTVEATNASGCSVLSTATTVTVGATPSASISQSAGLGNANCGTAAPILLTAVTDATSPTYQWYEASAPSTVLATTSTYSATISGDYYVKVTNSTGCSFTSTKSTVSTGAGVQVTSGTICANQTFTFTATTTGFTNPTFAWEYSADGNTNWLSASGTNTAQNYSTSVAGYYRVKVTDSANGTIISCSSVLNVNALPSVAITSNPGVSICEGQTSTLTATATAAGSASISTYQWLSGSTPINGAVSTTYAATLGAGYSILVTDSKGCQQTSAVTTVTVNPLPNDPVAIVTPPTCSVSTGTITVTPSGNAGDTYSIDGTTYQVSNIFVGLASGTYSVTTKNVNGCVSAAVTMVVASAPTTPVISSSISGNSLPNINTTETYSVSPVLGAVSYIWTLPNGWTGTSNSNSILATTAALSNNTGVISVKAVNASGCESLPVTLSVSIRSSSLAPPTVSNYVYCQNATATAVSATPSAGGTLNWYAAATGSTAPVSLTPSTAVPGTFSYFVSQTVGGQESDRVEVQVLVNALPTAASTTLTQPTCSVSTGSIFVDSPRGTGITYSIDGVNYTNTTGQFSNLASGQYTVTSKSSAGCISTGATVTINTPPSALAAPTVTTVQPTCNETVGSITVTSPVGTGLTYSIDGFDYTNTTGIFTNVAQGTYPVTAKNAAGCVSSTTSATISAPASLPAAPVATITQPTCSIATGTITITSPVGAGITYSINGGTFTNTTGIFSGLTPGNYTIRAQGSVGCIGNSSSFVINAQPATPAAVVASVTNPTCTVATGTITVVLPLGTGYTYSIDGTTYTNTTGIFTNVATGTYSVTVKNTSGCIGTAASVTVAAQPVSPASATATVTQPNCSVATGTITVNSPVSGNTYSIDATNYVSNGIFANVSAGTYSLKVKNSVGCLSSPTVVVVNVQPAIPATPVVTLVQPTCTVATGTITVTPPSGTGYTYSIDGSTYTNTTGIFTNVASGTYAVTVKNNVGCVSTATSAVIISQPTTPAAATITSSGSSICAGNIVTLTSSAATNYQWYKNNTLIVGATAQTFTTSLAGSFTVVTTNADGCDGAPSNPEVVTVNTPSTASISEGATLAFSNCSTTTMTLTATTNATNPSYQWTLNGTAINGATSSTLTVTQAGDYAVVVTENGCSTTSPISKVLAAPSLNTNGSSSVCQGETVTLTANSSGFSNPTYQWQVDTGAGFVNVASNGTSSTYLATTSGDYRVVVTDNTVVSNSCPITVTVNALPTASITTSATDYCVGSTATLTATTNASNPTYQWYIGTTPILNATNATYSPTQTGTYSVLITNQSGCQTTSAGTTITYYNPPVAPTATITQPTCTVATGTITVTNPTGTGYTYSIDGVDYSNTTGIFTPLASGTYSITAKSDIGCVSSATTKTIILQSSLICDSDGDGVDDAQESADGTDPNDPCDYNPTSQTGTPSTAWLAADCDGDGTPNGTDTNPLDPCVYTAGSTPNTSNPIWQAADCDGDGLINNTEGVTDTNGDGIPDFEEVDSDGDGIPDATEAGSNPNSPIDTDGDGTPNYKDLDSDGDGIPDSLEDAGCTGTVPCTPTDTDADGTPNYLDTDSDGDGIPDSVEDAGCTGTAPCTPTDTDGDGTPNYLDLDSDGDGIPDAVEKGPNGATPVDTDGDSTPDYLDLDSDGDGIPDSVEDAGCTGTAPCTPTDTDGDGTPNYLDLDSDGDGIPDAVEKGLNGATPVDTDVDGTPDYLDLDSDGDGIPDSLEDAGCTGTVPCTPTDTDGDGTPNYLDVDSDGDGIPDAVEKGPNGATPVDTDGDGTPNYLDTDSDGDGIPDAVEKGSNGATPVDTDGDSTPDYLDLDSDGDAIPDATEDAGCTGTAPCTPTDTDNDGTPNYLDVDSDGDGIPDAVEKGLNGATPVDTDVDGTPDYLDLDSDGDGIPDSVEKGPNGATPVDTNNDGTPDYLDLDSDGDGIPDSIEDAGCTGTAPCTPTDTDGDGTPNYLDLDSDGDGIPDAIEKGPNGATPIDTDNDGTPDYLDLDSDGDGIPDSVEDAGCTGTAPCTPTDTDGDGTPNYLDLDSDGDGIPDSVEKGTGTTPVDTDGDGIPDYLDKDSDNDGILDSLEDAGCTGTAPCTPTDTNGDGTPNYLDLDSDGDGIKDVVEGTANGVVLDANNDGKVDGPVDAYGVPQSANGGVTPPNTDGTAGTDPYDTDADGDGIPDSVEKGTGATPVDTDGDGTPDYRDLDSDGDGKPDNQEGTVDTDGDGLPNYLDVDSDGDGILDAVDYCPYVAGVAQNNGCPQDSDADGIYDINDLDDDNDGILDTVEGAACSPADPNCDTDGDGIPNRLDPDSDNDGIKDVVEGTANGVVLDANNDGKVDGPVDSNGVPQSANGGVTPPNTDGTAGTDPYDVDADGDGIPDSIEKGTGVTPVDTDGDGTPDYRDVDSDADGIPDSVEKGSGTGVVDTDGDSIPDYLDLDSDGDGIPDAVEKGPNGATPIDTDGDGTPDYRDLDSDNDGIPDAVEKGPNGATPVDSDGDGTPDYRDLDSDNDGIPDTVEKGPNGVTPIDSDNDGTPNYLDLDSDGDGIPDAVEKGQNGATPIDTDNDGTPDYLDLDSDNDGIPDAVEDSGCTSIAPCTPTDTDGDGTPDYRDVDSDNDGILDSIEKGPNGAIPVDTDGDGTPDFRDLDSDNDGILDSIEKGPNATPVDTDGDTIPDYRDLDSDGDGKPDNQEGTVDTDGDGLPNYLDVDSDGDGILDAVDYCPYVAGVAQNNGCPQDSDADGIYDINDLDDDNDGILDTVEGAACSPADPNCDTDGDGIPNRLDPDSDNDGIKDVVEGTANGVVLDANNDGKVDGPVDSNGVPQSANGGVTPPNTDGTAGTDPYDVDADGDGIPDSIEKGTGVTPVDTDGDGIPNYRDTDADGDGIPDSLEDVGCTGTAPCTPTDSDGDGTPNYLDLDADNDGILDSVENAACAPTTPVTLCDTDGDGTPNFLDLDSDGDGIKDVVEGTANGVVLDANGDGSVDGPIDANGVPQSANGGLTPPNTDGTAGTDPYDVDADGDGIFDSVEGTADLDSDGAPNYRDLDSDGDGVTDAQEIIDGTSPTNPCAFNPVHQTNPSTTWRALDCDSDGLTNGEEFTGIDDPATVVSPGAITNPMNDDTDGDGVSDDQEAIDGTNPNDLCSFNLSSQEVPTSAWLAADCDGDGVTNGQEITDGTNPLDPCSVLSSSQNLSAVNSAYRLLDCDGDGVTNGQELIDGTDPNNPCSFKYQSQNIANVTEYWKSLDCDNDGISNKMEMNMSELAVDTDYDGIPNYMDLDSDNDGIPDTVEQNKDSDGDGIADYQDLDSDNDGISDRIEGVADPDGDGIPNYLDLDSDGDVIKDAWEALPIYVPNRDDNYDGRIDKNGVFTDANSNGWADISEGSVPADTDKDGTPDYLDLDSDNDCIPDGVELTNDPDQDGVQNYRDSDSDGDGIPDNVEAINCNNPVDTDGDGIPDYIDLDSDNDGIPDKVEAGPNPAAPVDTDGDGTPDFRDLDSDNDGIPDAIEAGADPKHPVDTDGDGTPDYLDLDSDNDGIPDAIEAGKDPKNPVDTDKDGTPDYLDLDSDNDGIPDAIEAGKDPKNPVDTDGDGTPDFRDLDSDNDGIPDAIEAGKDPKNPVDTDGDGTPDFRDLDSDNDGIPDAIEAGKDPKNPVDTDGDGTPDFRDLDSDNDGIPDAIEAGKDPQNPVDTDGDGTPDFRDLDSDNDGIPDKFEAGANPKNPVDTDGDGTPDFRDLDSDNDGISDKYEAGSNPNNPVDTDGDGTPDFRDLDSDNDGISDKIEGIVDTDGDGTPDFRDIDSDNDSYLDKVEGNVDTDKDGTPDFRDLDSDNDAIPDKLENDIDVGGMPDCDGDGIDNRIDPDQCPTFATQGISPNNDGINDFLIIPGIKSYKNHLTIFNRWGNVVWEQENYQNNWGGETNQGDTVLSTDLKLPDGTYYYVIDYYGVKPSVGTYVYINRQAK